MIRRLCVRAALSAQQHLKIVAEHVIISSVLAQPYALSQSPVPGAYRRFLGSIFKGCLGSRAVGRKAVGGCPAIAPS